MPGAPAAPRQRTGHLVLGAVLAVLLLGGGCTRTRTERLASAERRPIGLEVAADGPWREVPVDADDPLVAVPVQRVVVEAPPPPVAAPRPRPTVPRAPLLELLPRRGPAPRTVDAQGRPLPPSKPPEAQRRERYLDHPTRMRAERIAFYCPAALESELHLSGAAVDATGPTRRVATGTARLICRELTLEAERITVTLRAEDPDVQITARGNVQFVTKQKVQVLREEGIRSLLITNEQVVPLR